MAFNTADPRAEYTATGGQTNFPFTFAVFLNTDVKVYLTPLGQDPDDAADLLTITTNYTVNLNVDPETGGSIDLVVPATSGDMITIVRDLPIDRTTDYQENGDLFSSTLNSDQNYQTYLNQQNKSIQARFLTLAESLQGFSNVLPAGTPQYFLRINAAGTAFEWAVSTTASQNEYDTSVFRLYDTTKKISFDASLITAGQTRSLKALDKDTILGDARLDLSILVIPPTDADYTLTATENQYGRIEVDTTNWTTARNIIMNNDEHTFLAVVNNTGSQNATFKTSAGTGILVTNGSASELRNDTVNVINYEVSSSTGTLSTDNLIHLEHQETSGTNGGSSIAGTQTRVLNTVVTNTIPGASLSVNQVTLPAGSYYMEGWGSVYKVNTHKASIYNTTDAAVIAVGESAYAQSASEVSSKSSVDSDIVVFAGIKVIELRHYTTSVKATDGLGLAVGSGLIELYANLRIWKVA